MNENRLTVSEIVVFLQLSIARHSPVLFNEAKQALTFVDKDGAHCALALPLVLPKMHAESSENLLQQLEDAALNYTIILIQAGAAALGWYANGELAKHKVIRKYMVRKSQGTAQLKYRKSKGKSRLGSRIRLRNSDLFFEEINETLATWAIIPQCKTILVSLPINLIHPLFTANAPVPFERHDPRMKKIPIDVRVPSLKELGHINWLVSRGELRRECTTKTENPPSSAS